MSNSLKLNLIELINLILYNTMSIFLFKYNIKFLFI